MDVIDVTLRESIYYENGITYAKRLAYLEHLVKYVTGSFLRYVEIGYIDTLGDAGLNYDPAYIEDSYGICNKKIGLAAMMHPNLAELERWDEAVLSKLSLVRIMLSGDTADVCEKFVDYFHNLGVKVAVNRIYSADVPMEKLISLEKNTADIGADMFYCADSSGSYGPAYMMDLCSQLMKHKGHMKIGLHLHDHMQMALCNTLISQSAGFEMADVSITGAGKGGGNPKMEYVLPLIFRDRVDVNMLTGLLKLIEFFDYIVGKDDEQDKRNFLNFLTGLWRFNLKEAAGIEERSRGREEDYIKYAFDMRKQAIQ